MLLFALRLWKSLVVVGGFSICVFIVSGSICIIYFILGLYIGNIVNSGL